MNIAERKQRLTFTGKLRQVTAKNLAWLGHSSLATRGKLLPLGAKFEACKLRGPYPGNILKVLLLEASVDHLWEIATIATLFKGSTGYL